MLEERLKQTILKTLGLSHFDLTVRTVASQVPNWDSLAQLSILAAVEKEYGVRFRGHEIAHLASVGDLQKLVGRKTPAAA